MIKKKISALMLAVCAVSSAYAREFRAPMTAQSGPLRYDVYKKKDKWTLNLWSIGNYRSANKAYIKHGTDSSDLTALLFGKQNFKVREMFTPGDTDKYTTDFNIFLGSTVLTPRVSYTERGMTLGGQFEYPVWQNKGRVGVRAAVPFKTVRMERDNDAETMESGGQQHVVRNDIARLRTLHNGGGGNVTMNADVNFMGNLYRYSAVKNLPVLVGGNVQPLVHESAANNNVEIGSTAYDLANAGPAVGPRRLNNGTTYAAQNIPFVAFYMPRNTVAPIQRAVRMEAALQDGGANLRVANDVDVVQGRIVAVGNALTDAIPHADIVRAGGLAAAGFAAGAGGEYDAGNQIAPLFPLDGAPEANKLYMFKRGHYAEHRAILDAHEDDIWLMPVFDTAGAFVGAPTVAALNNMIERYGAESAEQWLHRHGFDFMTSQRTGLGDVDVDAFYEHDFNADWRGEVMLGLRLPTGGSDDRTGNPYKANPLLGNGNHFEVKLGGNVGWATPLDWLNLKAAASYSFVLKSTEKRPAAFKGATIYGIGPKVDADVDWGYFIGNLDATLFHRKTDDLSTTIGYELFYKVSDNVSFKKSSLTNDEAWLGKQWVNVGPGGAFQDFAHELDNKGAERNTDRIAHRLRFESHWHAHKYMSLFAGGAVTFAGKNAAKEADMHCGMNVRF